MLLAMASVPCTPMQTVQPIWAVLVENYKPLESEPLLLVPPKTGCELHKALGQIFADAGFRGSDR